MRQEYIGEDMNWWASQIVSEGQDRFCVQYTLVHLLFRVCGCLVFIFVIMVVQVQ